MFGIFFLSRKEEPSEFDLILKKTNFDGCQQILILDKNQFLILDKNWTKQQGTSFNSVFVAKHETEVTHGAYVD